MAKRVLVPIAEGFEEIEALTIVDILRRAEAEVVLAGLGEPPIVGRSNVSVIPDSNLDEALASGPFDLIVLPGGLPNSHILRDDPRIARALVEQKSRGGYVGAICAAPLALERAGVLDGCPHTGHPMIKGELPGDGFREERVVVSGRVLTSRAAGTAMEFAFAIVKELLGPEKVEEVNAGVLARL